MADLSARESPRTARNDLARRVQQLFRQRWIRFHQNGETLSPTAGVLSSPTNLISKPSLPLRRCRANRAGRLEPWAPSGPARDAAESSSATARRVRRHGAGRRGPSGSSRRSRRLTGTARCAVRQLCPDRAGRRNRCRRGGALGGQLGAPPLARAELISVPSPYRSACRAKAPGNRPAACGPHHRSGLRAGLTPA